MTNTDELIQDLNNLRKLLNDLHTTLNSSGVERTNGLKNALGSECQYYRKSLKLFFEQDYEKLRDLVTQCSQHFDRAEKE
jgi:hypothetical protein